MKQEPALDHLIGSIESIVFSNEDTGFVVANLKEPKNDEIISIVGIMPALQPGESVFCEGQWKYHPRHGRQFTVEKIKQETPKDLMGIQKYLESGMIKGIGPAYAKKIVDTFGLKTLQVLDEDPSQLLQIDGIGPKKIEMIQKHWKDQSIIRDLMIFLQTHSIRPSLAYKIYKLYEKDSIKKIKENPYALARNIFGIGFKTADAIAQNIGFAKDSPHRMDAGLEHFLWEGSQEGHVCYPKEELITTCSPMLEVDAALVRESLQRLTHHQRLIELTQDGAVNPFIWIKAFYLAEMGIAKELNRLMRATSSLRTVHLDKAIGWVEEKMQISLASQQKEATLQSLTEKFSIITGGPGTGKSTITNGILHISEKLTDKILLAAPTGRAAKRMSEITRKKAFTIHSLLEYDFANKGFKKNQENLLVCDLLIIDEASMIDTLLMYHLLKAIPSHARVIMIGDVDQLPCVGSGNVLKDMIESEKIPVTKLKEIFRQARGSKIITNAHRINEGCFPDISNPPGSDFIFIESEDPLEIASRIIHLVQKELPEKYHFDSVDEIQVLSPMKKGTIGSENINHLLQQNLNPSNAPFMRMGRCFHEGDKVMQIKNNYDKKVFNGDIGRLLKIDLSEQRLIVNFDQKEVEYDFADLDELVLAYCVSIHKYQGSECPCVIFPIHTSHFKMLYRNLLYTGITRGKKLVVLIGTKKAIAIGVKNDEVKKRYSGLKYFIQEAVTKPALI